MRRPAIEPHLVRSQPVKLDEEVSSNFIPPFGVHVKLDDPTLQAVGIDLLIPRGVERIAEIDTLAIAAALSSGPAAVSELAEPFSMSLPSFLQHLDVLEDCGLVKSRKAGRVRMYQLTPRPLRATERWFEKQRVLWNRRLDQLDTYLEDLKEKQS